MANNSEPLLEFASVNKDEKEQIEAFALDPLQMSYLISESLETQLYYLRQLRSAAIIAVNQVQDIRLNLIDNPPQPALNEIVKELFFEVGLSLAWGLGGGIAVKKILTQKVKGDTTMFEHLFNTGRIYFVLDSFDEIPGIISSIFA